jgi:hypothetical protein
MPATHATGFPPAEVTALLRLEGLAAFAAAITAFQLIGGNWWLFAALILVPDLALLGLLANYRTGAWLYNFAHTYTLPAVLGAIGWFTGTGWAVAVALIFVAHIGADRALGYGLRYPDLAQATHLGWVGKAKKSEAGADPR